ncbi:hypothetical protein ACKS0A_04492 [Histoplasma ohiense]
MQYHRLKFVSIRTSLLIHLADIHHLGHVHCAFNVEGPFETQFASPMLLSMGIKYYDCNTGLRDIVRVRRRIEVHNNDVCPKFWIGASFHEIGQSLRHSFHCSLGERNRSRMNLLWATVHLDFEGRNN